MTTKQLVSKEIITEIESREAFTQLLEHNRGIVVVKFGATWCQPCKSIQPQIDNFFIQSPPAVTCCDLDIDTSFNIYSFLKYKKMVTSIPVILCFEAGNTTFIPDDSVNGTQGLQDFFARCAKRLN
jgi:thioredoxin-like negative regulator of GroEL